ncbi:unnamed protein product [Closterium sp. NIES-53]
MSSPRPHVQVNNYGRIKSPGDDICVAMAKNTRKAGRSTAASGASSDGDDGDEEHGDEGDKEHGDDGEEDWLENGLDDSASGDEIAPADIDEDDWWNRPVGSDDEVEEWRAGDSDNDKGADADGEHAEAASHATGATVDANAEADDEADAEARTEEEVEVDADAVAPADVAAVADADADAVVEADTDAAEGGADAVLFDGENSDDDPWNITGDDDVPLLKRRLRHHLQSKSKRARVVLSDDDSPGEERQPHIHAADKGKTKVVEAPAKATVRRCTSNKKRKNNSDPGSCTGAAKKKKKKKTPNKDDIMVNEALGSVDDYAEAAGPIPSFPEKAKPKDPTLHNPNSRPPSPRSKESKKRRRGWTDRESFWKFVCINRARHNIDLARIINADQTPLFVEMPAERTIEHRGARSGAVSLMNLPSLVDARLSPMCLAGIVCQAQDNGWMDESAVQTWLTKEVLPHLNPQRGQNARRAMLVLDSYCGHITQTMLQAYRTHSITPAVIPAGCTSRSQPLDVSIN